MRVDPWKLGMIIRKIIKIFAEIVREIFISVISILIAYAIFFHFISKKMNLSSPVYNLFEKFGKESREQNKERDFLNLLLKNMNREKGTSE